MTARKTVKKKTSTKKPSTKKAPAGKSAAGTGRTAKKAAPAKPARAPVVKKPAKAAPQAPPKPQEKKSGKKTSSTDVNLGHVFALRPRVRTSFRQEDFRSARLLLQDESYASIEEAARAVAGKALEMTLEGPANRGPRGGR